MTDCVLASVLIFEDGGSSASKLHLGTKEECERIMDRIPAISYGGEGKVVDSFLVIIPESEWEKEAEGESEE